MTKPQRIAFQNNDTNVNIVKIDALKLASLVIYQFEFAIANLQSGDVEILQQVQGLSDEVHALKLYIHDKSISYLADCDSQSLESRVILNTLKITNDLGFINDQIAAIVSRVEIYIKQNTKQIYWGMPLIARCASITIDMLKKSVSTFALLDDANTPHILLLEKQVSEEYDYIVGRLMGAMTTGPRSISFALETLHIAKSIERIALHSRYISQLAIDVINEYEKFNAAQAEHMAVNA
jgi:phosphate transport system protein